MPMHARRGVAPPLRGRWPLQWGGDGSNPAAHPPRRLFPFSHRPASRDASAAATLARRVTIAAACPPPPARGPLSPSTGQPDGSPALPPHVRVADVPADLAAARGRVRVLAAPPAAGKARARPAVERRVVVVVVLVQRVDGRLARDGAVEGAL